MPQDDHPNVTAQGSEYGDATLALVEQVFAEGAQHAALLMRHSAREFDPGIHDLLNPLTDHGRQLSSRLGAALPKPLAVRGYASPAQRCLDTAQLVVDAHVAAGGEVAGKTRPVEALGVFYALDQIRMWKGMRAAGGLVPYLQAWFAGAVTDDVMMPPQLAAQTVVRVMQSKLASADAEPGKARLAVCVSHDITVQLVRDRLLDVACGDADVAFLDAVICYQQDGSYWLRSEHGEPRKLP